MDLRGKTHKESSRGENIHVLRTGEPALIHAWELESLLINKFYNNPDFFNVFFFRLWHKPSKLSSYILRAFRSSQPSPFPCGSQ